MSITENFYPFSDPQIMTDEIFKMFGGSIENTSKAQRNFGFLMAETQVSLDIGTTLPITTYTGTYHFSNKILLDHAHVRNVKLVQFLDDTNSIYFTISGTNTHYMELENERYGVIGFYHDPCFWNGCYYFYPHRVQVIYETGLGSGNCYHPNILMSLTTYSTIVFNEIIGWGNEAPGDAGLSDFDNQNYSETRKGLINTVFGSSPKANFIHRLLTQFRPHRNVGL